jgi:Spy/CpxP family protein refolding chaperone
MNRFRLLAIGTMLLFALATTAQQPPINTSTKGVSAGEHPSIPTAEGQLTFLAARLDLTTDQQQKIKPILQELHDATVKLVQDENISREERQSKVGDSRLTADRKIRAILNDDQKKKLDQVEQEPHPELHGDVKGSNR